MIPTAQARNQQKVLDSLGLFSADVLALMWRTGVRRGLRWSTGRTGRQYPRQTLASSLALPRSSVSTFLVLLKLLRKWKIISNILTLRLTKKIDIGGKIINYIGTSWVCHALCVCVRGK